jgi:hypothetical protein
VPSLDAVQSTPSSSCAAELMPLKCLRSEWGRIGVDVSFDDRRKNVSRLLRRFVDDSINNEHLYYEQYF